MPDDTAFSIVVAVRTAVSPIEELKLPGCAIQWR